MPLSRIAVLLLLVFAVTAHAKRATPHGKPALQPHADCKTLSDSLVKLYNAGDPTYLTWDFAEAGCDSSQLYTAYYYQGIGFLFISAWKEALYFLNAARAIGGPRDEEILYHLWTVYRKLDRYSEMEGLTLELHRRYPNSLFLFEILDQWKSVKSPSHVAWNYSARAGKSSTPYLDNQFSNRFQGEIRQQAGEQRFREHGSVSLSSKWNEHLLRSFQTNLGGAYAYKGFTAEADWGAGYETPADDPTLSTTNGGQAILADSNWNFAQGHLALGYSLTTARGWNLGGTASLFLLNKNWWVGGLSHTQSFFFNDFILLGYLDFQKHWITVPKDTIFTPNLDGMYTFTASLTPYWSLGRHSFGAGPGYYLARSHYSQSGPLGLVVTSIDWSQTLSGTATYDFELRRWIRFAISGSSGREWDKFSGDSKYRRSWVYSADASVSLSF
jgi:hypothetical protein